MGRGIARSRLPSVSTKSCRYLSPPVKKKYQGKELRNNEMGDSYTSKVKCMLMKNKNDPTSPSPSLAIFEKENFVAVCHPPLLLPREQ